MKLQALAALVVMALAGCATPYQEEGGLFLGGVRAVRIDEDTLQVSSRVNSMTSADVMEHYLLRKCAEETLKAGYDLFMVGGGRDRSVASSVVLPGSYSSRSYFRGNSLHTRSTFMPAQSFLLVSPGESVYVKMAKGRKSAQATANVFDARDVLRYLATSTATPQDKGASPAALLAAYPDTRPAGMPPSVRGVGIPEPPAPQAAPPPQPVPRRSNCGGLRVPTDPDALHCYGRVR